MFGKARILHIGTFFTQSTPDGQSCEAFLAMVSVCVCVCSVIFLKYNLTETALRWTLSDSEPNIGFSNVQQTLALFSGNEFPGERLYRLWRYLPRDVQRFKGCLSNQAALMEEGR